MRELKSRCATCVSALMDIADKQDAEVWFAIGDAFSKGWGIERNRTEAMRWFQRATDAGHAGAMVRLAFCIKYPCPATEDAHERAVALFRQAAELGNASGMVWLGFAYRDGAGVADDPDEAARWFILATEAGDSHAMILAGQVLAGERSSPAEAEKWFLRAAAAGHKESHIALADLYSDRRSPLYNATASHHWYRVVAQIPTGSGARAMLALARQCRDGEGTERSSEMAKEWLHRLLETAPEHSAYRKEAALLLRQLHEDLL